MEKMELEHELGDLILHYSATLGLLRIVLLQSIFQNFQSPLPYQELPTINFDGFATTFTTTDFSILFFS